MNKVKVFFGVVFAAAVLGSAFAMPKDGFNPCTKKNPPLWCQDN